MTRSTLVEALKALHVSFSEREKTVAIHLFGIRYAEELEDLPMSELNLVAEEAGLSSSYGTELRKMVRLSKYVEEKKCGHD
ncbi:HTH-like domain-containing protein [Pseudooceanicola sp. 200-1SW]|uniref:HTH-like domain-containing protein n=1 Tax=Pseudooceanicola sp. 200-1SW TaxID=3425949 RepID=UPI003D7F5D8E